MNVRTFSLIFLSIIITFLSCNNDDDATATAVELRNRAEVYAEDLSEIETYLQTHFYNYEEYLANPDTSDFEIIFDTIAGENANKIPLKDQVTQITVTDPVESDLEYKLYILKVREGGGENPFSSDRVLMNYEGFTPEASVVFDSAVTPANLLLTTLSQFQIGVVEGFKQGAMEFKTATSSQANADGTTTYNDFGIGTIFIPSGLGYFSSSQNNIPSYTPIIFNIYMFKRFPTDPDGDSIPSFIEDLNGNEDIYDDDTDEDNIPNFSDNDDDGDNILTINEDLEPDSDLNVDRDGDGDPTNDIGDGDPTNDDTDGDNIPNYLDDDTIISKKDI